MISQEEIKALKEILSENKDSEIKIARSFLEDIAGYFENGGWNDIGNGLPPIGQPLAVTIKDNLQGMPNQLRYPVYYVKDTMKDGYAWKWFYGDMVYDLVPDISEVVAWKQLPEIYCVEDVEND